MVTERKTDETRRTMEQAPPDDLGSLIRALTSEASLWVRQETALAKAEFSEMIDRLFRTAILLGGGTIIIHAGAIVTLVALSLCAAEISKAAGLADGLSLALGFGLVGGVTIAAGVFALHRARERLSKDEMFPDRTTETLRETKEWAKQKIQ